MCRGGTLPPAPRRKRNRLKNYDYSLAGAYFVTICTEKRKGLFGKIVVGAAPCRPILSPLGKIVDEEIQRLSQVYEALYVDCYVVMPNHVHMIIVIGNDSGRQGAAPTPTLSQIVGGWKRKISIRAGFSPWQKSFHEHIIRNEESFNRIVEYIEYNPLIWEDDRYFIESGRQGAAPTKDGR